MLSRPEFMYNNHLISLKDADMELLEQALTDKEDEESKRSLLASQENVTSQANIKAKDAKAKDTKAKAKGGAAVDADKNSPKPIEIEYEEIASEKDYVLIEKSFQQGKSKPALPAVRRSQASKSAMAAAGATSASGSQQTAQESLALKKSARLTELHQTYDMVRAQPYTLAVVMKLNYVPPPPPPVEAEPVEVDTKPTGKDAKGKGKGKK